MLISLGVFILYLTALFYMRFKLLFYPRAESRHGGGSMKQVLLCVWVKTNGHFFALGIVFCLRSLLGGLGFVHYVSL